MKSVKIILALLLALGMCSFSYAQLGKLKDKATSTVTNKKDKATEKPVENTKNNANSNVNTNANTNAGSAATPNVSKPTVEFATDYTFKNKKTDFEPGESIFVRLVTPKPMGEMFKDAFKLSDIPLSGAMAIAIGKNADDENPIVITQYTFFPDRYKNDKQFAITLQIDQQKLDNLAKELEGKVPFNSAQTMAKGDMKLLWDAAALQFTPQKYQWTIFFFYRKANSEDIAEAGSGVFTYNITNENRQKLTAGLNEVDRDKYAIAPDDGVKTDFHRNNIGKLVFGTQPVSMDGAGATTSFANLSEGIYARAFLPQSIRNFYASKGKAKDFAQNYLINITAGGKEYNIYHKGIAVPYADAEKATTLVINIAPSSEKDNNAITKAFMYIFSTLPAGKQKISMKVRVQYNYTDADTYVLKSDVKVQDDAYLVGEGTFEVNINPADRDAVVKKYGDKFEGNINTYQDKALAALVKQQYPAIAQKIWGEEIVRNVLGQVIYRTVMVDCARKNAKGEHIVDRTEVKQQFIGNKWDNRLTGVLVPFGYHVPAINIKP
ncbi:hypothetical protein [Raineya sp.]